MRWRSARGQTFTELLMISGLVTAVAIVTLQTIYQPTRLILQELTQCIVDGALNGVACGSGTIVSPPAPPPPAPAPAPPPTPSPSPSPAPSPAPPSSPTPPPPPTPPPSPPSPPSSAPPPAPPPPVCRVIPNPTVNGLPMDVCLAMVGTGCPYSETLAAATAYCQSLGLPPASAATLGPPRFVTGYVNSGATCDSRYTGSPSCGSIAAITCGQGC